MSGNVSPRSMHSDDTPLLDEMVPKAPMKPPAIDKDILMIEVMNKMLAEFAKKTSSPSVFETLNNELSRIGTDYNELRTIEQLLRHSRRIDNPTGLNTVLEVSIIKKV